VRLSDNARELLRTVGNAGLGVALGLATLGIGFIISLFASGQPSATRPSPTPTAAQTVAGFTANPVASPTPPEASTPGPSPTPDPLEIAPYRNAGRSYAALRAPVGYEYRAPFAGTVQVRLYQLINGEVRVGSNVPSQPFFPYITLSGDWQVVYRPGTLGIDTELLAQDGASVEAGTPLFRTIGEGPSSWRTFYDRAVTANVIVSVTSVPAGFELDPVQFLSERR
jgi:hypothetical protein